MFTISLDRKNKKPIYQQIYESIRSELEKGGIEPNAKLPSKRELATELQVSQITVEAAYGQLKAEGYIYTKAKSGYYAEDLLGEKTFIGEKKLSSFSEKKEERTYLYDFKTGGMDTASFPFSLWAKLTRETLGEDRESLLNAINPKGYLPLRQEIAKYLQTYRDISVNPEQIVIGAGWEYLFGIIVQLLGRKSRYGIEDPGYGKMSKILRKNDCEISFLPIDKEGLSLLALYDSQAEVVHVTPSHQFPLGIVTSASRRRSLLQWAGEKKGRYIIEDDYDSEFRFSGSPIPAMYGLDNGEHVIYIKTFTKSLAPSLRIAYMVLPPLLMEEYEKEMSFYASTVSGIEQRVLYRFMERGGFRRHINRLRVQYKKKQNLFLETVGTVDNEGRIKVIGERSGMPLLLQAKGLTEDDMVKKAAKAGIRVYGISEYYKEHFPKEYGDTVVCGFSAMSEQTLKMGAEALVKAWLCGD